MKRVHTQVKSTAVVLFCLKQPAVSPLTSCTWVAGKVQLYCGLTVHFFLQINVKQGRLKQHATAVSNDFDCYQLTPRQSNN